jgi:O-antigen/teichoic acid export membrane protein
LSVRTIILGTAAMSSINMLRILAQVLVIPVLSRLLSPSDYGLVGIAMPFVLFAMMLADAGIGMSLIRTPATKREEWSSCFWVSVLFGVVLAIIVGGLGKGVAIAFAEPALSGMVTTLGVTVLLQAVFLIPRAAQQQKHQFGVIAATEITAIALGMMTAVTIAVYGGGAWALVGQQVVFFGVRLLLTLWLSPFRPIMRIKRHLLKGHVAFSRDVLANNVLGFFTQSIDNLVIGKVLGSAAVGIYAMTFQFARLPMLLISGPLQYVLYAQLAKVKDDREAVGRALFAVSRGLAILVFPAVGMVAVAHQAVFDLLLSSKWAAAGDLFMIVAPACALQAVTAIGGTVRMVLGRTDIMLRTTVEFGVLRIIGLVLTVWFGLEWTAFSYNLAVLLYCPRSLMLILPAVGGTVRAYFRLLAVPIVVTVACMALFREITDGSMFGEWAQLLIGAILALAGIAASALAQRGSLLEEIAFLQRAGA